MDDNTEEHNDGWKVKSRSILKTSPNYVKKEPCPEKKAKFDEANILQTYHPPDRDYGLIAITEPKTPYNFASGGEKNEQSTPLNTSLLLEKLGFAATAGPRNYSIEDIDSSDDLQSIETIPSADRTTDFDRRRKEHYKEYEVVKLAKELIKKDLENEDDEVEDSEATGPSTSNECSSYRYNSDIKSDSSTSDKKDCDSGM